MMGILTTAMASPILVATSVTSRGVATSHTLSTAQQRSIQRVWLFVGYDARIPRKRDFSLNLM